MISAHRRGLGTPGVVAKDDGGCAEERRARKTIDEGVRDPVHQFREFLIALWLSPGRQGLALLTTGTLNGASSHHSRATKGMSPFWSRRLWTSGRRSGSPSPRSRSSG